MRLKREVANWTYIGHFIELHAETPCATRPHPRISWPPLACTIAYTLHSHFVARITSAASDRRFQQHRLQLPSIPHRHLRLTSALASALPVLISDVFLRFFERLLCLIIACPVIVSGRPTLLAVPSHLPHHHLGSHSRDWSLQFSTPPSSIADVVLCVLYLAVAAVRSSPRGC